MSTISDSKPNDPAPGELAGRAAIVTGLGIAQALAREGADVMLNGFGDAAAISQIRKDIEQSFGVKTVYSAADMSMPSDIEGMVDAARSAFGKVDILVNNAGIQHVEAIETFPPAKWDAIIAHQPFLRISYNPRCHRGDEGAQLGAALLISLPPMRWWPRRSNRPMSRLSTVSRA